MSGSIANLSLYSVEYQCLEFRYLIMYNLVWNYLSKCFYNVEGSSLALGLISIILNILEYDRFEMNYDLYRLYCSKLYRLIRL